jgi:hypothetical protein
MRISAENKFLVKVVVLAWVVALLCYGASSFMKFQHEEARIDSILGDIDKQYLQQPVSREPLRHLVMDLLALKQRDSAFEELFLHLSVALFIAGMLVVSVDFAMRNMSHRETEKRTEEVSKAIWRALLNRFVPQAIAIEIEGILKSDVCRIKPRYIVRILREPYRNIPSNHVVVRRELSYWLRNLTPEDIPAYPIRAQLTASLNATVETAEGTAVQLPRMRSMQVGGAPIVIENPQEVLFNTRLEKMESDHEALAVYSVAEELYPKIGQATYILTVPCVGLEVMVLNELHDEVEVKEVYLTGGWVDKLKKQQSPDTWACEDGVLPGTVLVVGWVPIPTPT